MRKLLIVTALIAGAGMLAAAQASEDKAKSVQESSQTESNRKDGERVGATRETHSRESGKSHREEHKEAYGREEDEDRD